MPDGSKKFSVDPESIPEGPNNRFVHNLKFAVDMITEGCVALTLTDNEKSRFSIPEIAVNKPAADKSQNLDALGFTYDLEPFSFSMKDVTNPDHVYLTTRD